MSSDDEVLTFRHFHVQIWIKKDVLKIGNPKDAWIAYAENRMSGREFAKYKRYLHNLDGPAVLFDGGTAVYWIDGVSYKTREEWEIAAHGYKFARTMKEVMDEDT